MSAKRVTVVTAGHPSTCPRMVKAADAMVNAGYDVRFVSVDYIDWATTLDRELTAARRWRWSPIPLRRADHPLASRWASARHRLARTMAATIDPSGAPSTTVARAYGRTHPELVTSILAEPFEFVYGGTVGALAAVAEAARHAARPFALDFEDFHPAESEEPDAPLTHALATRVVRDAIVGASFTTAASTPIADAYASAFDTTPVVIHNVVPRPVAEPGAHDPTRALKLYWFSQVIGARRGLEDIVRAIGVARIPAELHLRGAARAEYVDQLRALARREGAVVEIVVHAPGAPDEMVELCAPFDVGLSLEQEGVLNRALCLPNKPLTYFAAGLAVLATDTPGQLTLKDVAGDGIWYYRPGDVARLADGLVRWHADRAALARARACSYEAAIKRFHWEHPLERGALVSAIEQALS
jgi:glycosyltransferase involved in cell wall biosynthesis